MTPLSSGCLALLLLLLLVRRTAAAVVINEIMYHHAANEMFEYVELFNSDAASAVSVSGWSLKIGPNSRLTRTNPCLPFQSALFFLFCRVVLTLLFFLPLFFFSLANQTTSLR